MKLFHDSLFNTPDIKIKVGIEVENPDDFVGKYPYFGEMYTVDNIKELLNLSELNDDVYAEVWTKLYSRKYRYPLTKEGNKVGSGMQDRALSGAVEGNRQQILILDKLWKDRLSKYEEYLNKTYTSVAEGSGKSDSETTSETNSTASNTSNSTNEGKSNSSGDGTTQDTDSGSNSSTSSGKSNGGGSTNSAHAASVLPETLGNANDWMNPDMLNINHASGTDKRADRSSNNETHSEESKGSSSGTRNGTTHSSSTGTSEGKSTSTGSSKGDVTGTGKTSGTSSDSRTSEGRNKDLIGLSDSMQDLSRRARLVDLIYRVMAHELSAFVGTVDTTFYNQIEDPFTGDWGD